MANVIDALLITLGLDTKGVKKGSDEANAATKGIATGATKASNDMSIATKKMAEGFRTVRNEVLGLFALITAGRAIKTIVGDITTGDAALGRFSAQIGTNIEDLGAWQQAVIRMGGSAEETSQTFGLLVRSFYDLKQTGDSAIVPLFRAMGTSLVDARGNIKPVVDQLHDMADYIQRTHMSQPEATSFFGRFGITPGMVTLLMQGRTGVDQLVEQMRKLGVANAEDAKRAQELKANLANLQQGFESLIRTVVNDFSPMVIQILTQMSDWLTANREWLAQKIDEYIKTFLEYVKQVPAELDKFTKAIQPIIDALGGWKNAIKDIFELWLGAQFAKVLLRVQALSVATGAGLAGLIGLAARLAPLAVALGIMKPTAANAGEDELVANRRRNNWAGAEGPYARPPEADDGTGGPNGPRARTGFTTEETDDLFRRFLQYQAEEARAREAAISSAAAGGPGGSGGGLGGVGGGSGGFFGGGSGGAAQKFNSSAGREAYRYWITHGYTPAGAAAMVAAEASEGGFREHALGDYVNGQPTAVGAFQWHSDRVQRILAATGIDVRTASLTEQRHAADLEMRLGLDPQAGAAYQSILNARDPYRAGAIHSLQVERPGGGLGTAAQRGALAQQINQLYGGNPGLLETISPLSPGLITTSPMDLRRNSSNSTEVTIGQVNVHTQATDAHGIAGDMNSALDKRLTLIQSNEGVR